MRVPDVDASEPSCQRGARRRDANATTSGRADSVVSVGLVRPGLGNALPGPADAAGEEQARHRERAGAHEAGAGRVAFVQHFDPDVAVLDHPGPGFVATNRRMQRPPHLGRARLDLKGVAVLSLRPVQPSGESAKRAGQLHVTKLAGLVTKEGSRSIFAARRAFLPPERAPLITSRSRYASCWWTTTPL